ncbi:MAG: tRNA 2-thiouridine(34) synthase MnmA [Abditibacteriota bacterium]|nr:tRNA 2-thiouridine(34) synthase MnmA [Abditibacteriota bacterium]
MAEKIVLLMSGGTDSSAAALLLLREGWEVVGLTFPVPRAEGGASPVPEAAELARALGIEHHYVDVSEVFRQRVTEPFRREYSLGRTPCPCAECNAWVKFGFLWDYARSTLGAVHFATGHYARAYCEGGEGHLAAAGNAKKDQSYFLYGVKKDRLPYLHFPLAERTKDEARALLAEAGLRERVSGESMDLCFAGREGYRAVIGKERPGPVTDTSGRVLGSHTGIENYTIGQRKGLGIPHTSPLYVVETDPASNTVVLGEYEEGLTDTLEISGVNVLEPRWAKAGEELLGKIRSTGSPKPCRIESVSEQGMTVRFAKEFFVTSPGQKLVLYDSGGTVVLGGTIEKCRRKACCG